jgi:Gas vesicle synthesis protein GvpL/GvpF
VAATQAQETQETSTVYVYGIVRDGAVRKVKTEGVGGGIVEQLERDGLAALVTALPTTELRVKRRDLDRHLRVLEEVCETATVVPCSFATVAASDEIANGLLVDRRGELLSALDSLDGKIQMNVKAVYAEEELLRDIVATNPEVAGLRASTKAGRQAGYHVEVQLGEVVAAAVADRRQRDAERLVRELAASAADVVVDEPGPTAFKGSFLVSRASLSRFDKEVEAIARREQPLLQFEVIGPLPPTAFASAYAGV